MNMFWFSIIIVFIEMSKVNSDEGDDYSSLPELTDGSFLVENVDNPVQDGLELSLPESTVSTKKITKEEAIVVHKGTRHGFFRSFDAETSGAESRRVFGGAVAELKEFTAVCALLDRLMGVRCSATVVAEYWALTAAHCISPRIVYVKYNTRRPGASEGNLREVTHLYRHPGYKVIQKDEGQGMDVTLLHHDVGLARTKEKMVLDDASKKLLGNLQRYHPVDLRYKEIQVLGFGRTERSVLGEELFSVKLLLVGCDREEWAHCVCGVARGGHSRGVCSGDSGGPVVFRGVMIGVTSMGPVECALNGQVPPTGATSVFTSLYQYADVINATIFNLDPALRMRQFEKSAALPTLETQLLLFNALILVPLPLLFGI